MGISIKRCPEEEEEEETFTNNLLESEEIQSPHNVTTDYNTCSDTHVDILIVGITVPPLVVRKYVVK